MDVVALSNLLQDCCRDDETEEEKRKVESSTIMTPASFGSTIRNNGVCKENIHSNEIWTHEEGPSLASSCVDHYDDKIEPSYQIYFKQEVGTEDIFLGTDKSPGSFDCSHVVVKVHFPGATLDELNLDVRSHSMLVESSDKYVNFKATSTRVCIPYNNLSFHQKTHN